ncbi:hypothetical protein GGR57DRAFT_475849 [Xylariaceae sp. FL1272]|nr:hypothetical protein GGR57DRAFT_475849 [Xylariaceae sp. FL1272]
MSESDLQELAERGYNITNLEADSEIQEPDVLIDTWIDVPARLKDTIDTASVAAVDADRRNKDRMSRRQLQGGFLDGSAYEYLGCGEDTDPCAIENPDCFTVSDTVPDGSTTTSQGSSPPTQDPSTSQGSSPSTQDPSTSTSQAPPPTSTSQNSSPTSTPTPTPIQEVWIPHFYTSALGGGDLPFPIVAEYWEWFEVADGNSVDFCTASAVYEEFDFSGDDEWPVTMDPGKEILGHQGCVYTGNDDGPGWMECDDVPRFNCVEDGRRGEDVSCSDDPTYTARYEPRVRCIFLG